MVTSSYKKFGDIRVANSKILLRTAYFTAGNQLGTKIEHAKPLQNQ